MLKRIQQIFHTVKYLKPCQITGQIRNRLRSRLEDPARLLSLTVPAIGSCRWPEDIEILPPGMQQNSEEDIFEGRMMFLNRQEQVGWMPDWQSECLPKLWLYNLHYFEWLWALEYGDAKDAVLDWIENHNPAKGQQGWEPYPISLRLMNLCGVFFAKYRSEIKGDKEFRKQLWENIYLQSEWLMSHLETHLLGNHYFENASALAFVGSCFDGEDGERWLNRGTEILQSEIPEQILADGMHFELSPMYHSRMLYLMGILSATGNKQLKELVDEPIQRMAQALSNLCHPDGQIALFNDSAFGIYSEPEKLLEYCSQTGVFVPFAASRLRSRQDAGGTVVPQASRLLSPDGAFSLPDAGFYGWRDQSGNYLVCDYGKIGPDYQPGHVHADMLSYELSLNGHRVIVDSGVYDYEPSETRRYARSTAAHNTVEIDGQNQCEVWGTFRVARRGYPQDVKFNPSSNGFELSGSHDGYKRLAGKPRHSRSMCWNAQELMLKVCDQVHSKNTVKVVSRIHLHPGCSIQSHSETLVEIKYPAGDFRIKIQDSSKVSVVTGWYFPEFGKKIPNSMIEISAEGLNSKIIYEVQSCA